MQTVSQLYETIKAGLHRVEVRVRIDREHYPEGYWYLLANTGDPILTDENEKIGVAPFPVANLTEGTLFGVTITGGLYSSQTFAIGSCVSREIEVKFILGNAEIPRMAKIQPEIRLVNDAGDVSEWIPKGTFWLDTRELDKETGIMTIRGYDAMLKGEATYIASGSVGDWPKTMSSVANEIAGLMCLTMDSRNALNTSYVMQLPTGYSMREILGYIAAANCGNWIVTDKGELRLIRVNDTVDNEDLGLAAMTYHIGEPYQEFSKVELNLSDTVYVERGDDTGRTLIADCPIVTTSQGEIIAAAVLAALDGFIYTPLTADGAILDPAMEIGDTVTVGTTTSVIASQTIRLDSLCASDISAPGEDELDHEYPYQSAGQRKIERKISGIEASLYIGPNSIIARIEDLGDATDELSAKYSEIEETLDSIRLTVSNGSTSSTITLSATGISTQSVNISFTGMVTFASLSDPTSTGEGSVTYIDGAHIKTGTISADAINVNNLKVKTVYTNDDYEHIILTSESRSSNLYIYIGPDSSTSGRTITDIFIYSILTIFDRPSTYSGYAVNQLQIDTNNRRIEPGDNSETWDIGSSTKYFHSIYAREYHLGPNSRAMIGYDINNDELYCLDNNGYYHVILWN